MPQQTTRVCNYQLCGDNTECTFDAIVASMAVGAATLEAGEEFEAEVLAVGGGECIFNGYLVTSIENQPRQSGELLWMTVVSIEQTSVADYVQASANVWLWVP